MRECGECSLCCKIPRVVSVDKPSNKWCQHCDIGKGCLIHETRPQVCRDFHCVWLRDERMPEEWRPDRAHAYVSGRDEDEALKVFVDAAHPDAWRSGAGQRIVGHVVSNGRHALVVVDRQINFVPALGKNLPEKLIVEWLL